MVGPRWRRYNSRCLLRIGWPKRCTIGRNLFGECPSVGFHWSGSHCKRNLLVVADRINWMTRLVVYTNMFNGLTVTQIGSVFSSPSYFRDRLPGCLAMEDDRLIFSHLSDAGRCLVVDIGWFHYRQISHL